jgi:hypothetical protein
MKHINKFIKFFFTQKRNLYCIKYGFSFIIIMIVIAFRLMSFEELFLSRGLCWMFMVFNEIYYLIFIYYEVIFLKMFKFQKT